MSLDWLANFLRALFSSPVTSFRAYLERRAADRKIIERNRAWADCWQDEADDLHAFQPDDWVEQYDLLMDRARAESFVTGSAPSARPRQMSQAQWEDLARQHDENIHTAAVEHDRAYLRQQPDTDLSGVREPLVAVVENGVADVYPPSHLVSVVATREPLPSWPTDTERRERQRQEQLPTTREARLSRLCQVTGRENRPDGWPSTGRYPASPPAGPIFGALWTEYDEFGCTYHYGYDGIEWVCLESRMTARGTRAAQRHHGEPHTTTLVFSGTRAQITDHVQAQRQGITYDELIASREAEASRERQRREALTVPINRPLMSGGVARSLGLSPSEVPAVLSQPRYQVRMEVTYEDIEHTRERLNYTGYSTFSFFGSTVHGAEQSLLMLHIQGSSLGDPALQLIANLTDRQIDIRFDQHRRTYVVTFSTTNTEAGRALSAMLMGSFASSMEPQRREEGTQETVTVPIQPPENEAQSSRRLNLSHRERKEENEPHVEHQSHPSPVRRGLAKRRKRDE